MGPGISGGGGGDGVQRVQRLEKGLGETHHYLRGTAVTSTDIKSLRKIRNNLTNSAEGGWERHSSANPPWKIMGSPVFFKNKGFLE
jgi:hypothetical protein